MSTVTRFALAAALALAAAAPAGLAHADDLGSYFARLPRTPNADPTPVRKAAAPAVRPAQYAAAPAAYAPGVLDVPTLERTVFHHINLYRLSKGLRPVGEHNALAGTARGHSDAMASGAKRMNHDGMYNRLQPHLGGLFGSRAGGEILAYARGQRDPAIAAITSWIRSTTHREIMEGEYSRVGVGIAVSPDGAYYFTALFVR